MDEGWLHAASVRDLPDGRAVGRTLRPGDGDPLLVLLVRSGGQVSAFVNACAHQGLRMDGAGVDAVTGTLRCPWHGYVYDLPTGACRSVDGDGLQALEVRRSGDEIWVRPV